MWLHLSGPHSVYATESHESSPDSTDQEEPKSGFSSQELLPSQTQQLDSSPDDTSNDLDCRALNVTSNSVQLGCAGALDRRAPHIFQLDLYEIPGHNTLGATLIGSLTTGQLEEPIFAILNLPHSATKYELHVREMDTPSRPQARNRQSGPIRFETTTRIAEVTSQDMQNRSLAVESSVSSSSSHSSGLLSALINTRSTNGRLQVMADGWRQPVTSRNQQQQSSKATSLLASLWSYIDLSDWIASSSPSKVQRVLSASESGFRSAATGKTSSSRRWPVERDPKSLAILLTCLSCLLVLLAGLLTVARRRCARGQLQKQIDSKAFWRQSSLTSKSSRSSESRPADDSEIHTRREPPESLEAHRYLSLATRRSATNASRGGAGNSKLANPLRPLSHSRSTQSFQAELATSLTLMGRKNSETSDKLEPQRLGQTELNDNLITCIGRPLISNANFQDPNKHSSELLQQNYLSSNLNSLDTTPTTNPGAVSQAQQMSKPSSLNSVLVLRNDDDADDSPGRRHTLGLDQNRASLELNSTLERPRRFAVQDARQQHQRRLFKPHRTDQHSTSTARLSHMMPKGHQSNWPTADSKILGGGSQQITNFSSTLGWSTEVAASCQPPLELDPTMIQFIQLLPSPSNLEHSDVAHRCVTIDHSNQLNLNLNHQLMTPFELSHLGASLTSSFSSTSAKDQIISSPISLTNTTVSLNSDPSPNDNHKQQPVQGYGTSTNQDKIARFVGVIDHSGACDGTSAECCQLGMY